MHFYFLQLNVQEHLQCVLLQTICAGRSTRIFAGSQIIGGKFINRYLFKPDISGQLRLISGFQKVMIKLMVPEL